jgi:hypothetical protein
LAFRDEDPSVPCQDETSFRDEYLCLAELRKVRTSQHALQGCASFLDDE